MLGEHPRELTGIVTVTLLGTVDLDYSSASFPFRRAVNTCDGELVLRGSAE